MVHKLNFFLAANHALARCLLTHCSYDTSLMAERARYEVDEEAAESDYEAQIDDPETRQKLSFAARVKQAHHLFLFDKQDDYIRINLSILQQMTLMQLRRKLVEKAFREIQESRRECTSLL